MRTVGMEGRCWVISANQCMRRKDLPDWIKNGGAAAGDGTRKSVSASGEGEHNIILPGKGSNNGVNGTTVEKSAGSTSNEFVSRGGSVMVSPMGEMIRGPLWEVDDGDESLMYAEVDFDDCERGRLDFDAAGSYSRSDAFKLTVEGLDLTPPP